MFVGVGVPITEKYQVPVLCWSSAVADLFMDARMAKIVPTGYELYLSYAILPSLLNSEKNICSLGLSFPLSFFSSLLKSTDRTDGYLVLLPSQ